MAALERSHAVLRIICDESEHLSRHAVAYILNIGLDTLGDMLAGAILMRQDQMKVLADLTGLPEMYFTRGLDQESYKPVVDLAMELGLTPDQTIQMIKQATEQPARPHAGDGQASRVDQL
ncbi:MAG TPA: hypothetical protein VNT01_07520 [Symbiobacteriaceae bacterium]|nr:hypothetical protein [Symbiobacteriaceae bacterium]